MKRIHTIPALGGLVLLSLSLTAFQQQQEALPPGALDGAWQVEGDPKKVAILVDGYFAQSTFRENSPEFLSTQGGTFSFDGTEFSGTLEFHSANSEDVGQSFSLPAKLQGDKLTVTYPDGSSETWTRTDRADSQMAGVWRITQREQDGQMHEIPLRARRTLKILSGNRFQWAAINVETGEFSGTGGGTYTFENGKYTEKIEFFSRDNSRVGMSLSFEGEIKDGDWHHRGKSSKGDPIYEVWSKM